MKYFFAFLFIVSLGLIFSYPESNNSEFAIRDIASSPKKEKKSTPPLPPKKYAEITTAILCYESNDCEYAETDPRSYSFAVAKDISGKLELFLEDFRSNPALAEDAEEFANEAIMIPDGYVQSKALEIYALLPPSSANLQKALMGLENTPNPILIEQAMKDWKRYLGTSEEERIQEFLAKFIAYGAQFSSEKASEEILSFLNDRSEPLFRDALSKMQPESTPAKNLRAALEQFHLKQSGG
jgi:hypothetical protein